MVLPPTAWRLYAAIGGVVFVLAALAGQQLRIMALRADLAIEQRDRAAERLAAGEALLTAQAEARDQEQLWQRRVDAARSTYERNLQAAVERERRVTAGGLRFRADAFALGTGTVSEDTLDACRGRATALGRLLGEADSLAGEFALAADRHADEVRVLRAAWPQPVQE